MLQTSRINWIWIGCTAALAVAGCLRAGISIGIDQTIIRVFLIWCVTLLAMSYCHGRQAVRPLVGPLDCLAQLLAVVVINAILQYPLAMINRPLIDADLGMADQMLLFSWPAVFACVLDHPMLLKMLSAVYLSFLSQSFLVCFVAWYRPYRASIFLTANALTLTGCFTIFAVWPAGGAFEYYHPVDITSGYLEQFIAARSGLVTTLSLGQMQGIIQFPSYHAAGAVLLSYAFAGFPRWIVVPAIIFETVLIVSAIPIGGHHLVDVLAGAALAIASIALARYISVFEPASPIRGIKLFRAFRIRLEAR